MKNNSFAIAALLVMAFSSCYVGIQLLEEKITDLRKKYFQLKHADVISDLKGCL